MSEEILPQAAYREVYSGYPVYRDKNGKAWFLNNFTRPDRTTFDKPTALANGQEPQKEWHNVFRSDAGDYFMDNRTGLPVDQIYVLSNTPIPNEPPPEFKGWFVDGQNRVAPPTEATQSAPTTTDPERLRRDTFALAIYCALLQVGRADVYHAIHSADALIAELDKEAMRDKSQPDPGP